MTTTKKKAKRSTRATGMAADVAEMGAEVVRLGRVSAALEGIYQIHMLSRFEALSRRIEALEQAQRPPEKPARDVLYGKYRIAKSDGTPVDPAAKYFVLRVDKDPHARTALRRYARLIEAESPGLTRDLLLMCGNTDEPTAPAAPSEESRLRDAVVEAALAWFSAGEDLGPGQKQESMMTAIVALRAHRAKKGGA
ncbi:MAG: hypothetical protein IPL77_11030 [Flavobacteriales bacterium]|nr:hypothetical protein [Flavobacteriales bacterium]